MNLTVAERIGVDLTGILGAHGDRRRRDLGRDVHHVPHSRLRRRELPQRGPGQSSRPNRILAYCEGHRKLLLDFLIL